MKYLVALIGLVIVLAGCVPFKPTAEVYPTIVANDTPTQAWSLPTYVPPQQTYVPVEQPETVAPATENPYLKAENFTDIQSYFPNYVPKVPQTWWIPRYDAPPTSQVTTIFWTGTANVEVTAN